MHRIPAAAGKALKGVAAVSVMAAGVVIGGSFLKSRPKDPLPGIDSSNNEVIQSDPDFYGICLRLSRFRMFNMAGYQQTCAGVCSLLILQATIHSPDTRPELRLARKAADHVGTIVEGVRTMRAYVKRRLGEHAPKEIEDFDDIASSLQKACNDCQFNITMTLQKRIM